MKAETRAVVLRVLNLEHYDPEAGEHGGVLASVIFNALLDLRALRATVNHSDDLGMDSGELSNAFDSLIGRIEAGVEVARDVGREGKAEVAK